MVVMSKIQYLDSFHNFCQDLKVHLSTPILQSYVGHELGQCPMAPPDEKKTHTHNTTYKSGKIQDEMHLVHSLGKHNMHVEVCMGKNYLCA